MNRYKVTGIFAQGAQSRLYIGQDVITGETCLLKTGDGVKQEALLSLELNHPYIAHAYDFGTHPEIGTYAAYPKFSEPSIRTWCSAKNLVRSDFRRVVLQIAEVLAFMHHRGWLYHDFKPEHFLVGEDSIKVLDLGVCTKINESHTSNTFSGTFPYISPERLTGRPFDVRSDIFGLGMMLLHLFYREENWSGEPSLSMLQQLQKKSHDLPQGFWKNLIVQMTSLEPSQRPESAAELWKKLLPQKARGTFLIFPVPAIFSLANEILEAKERIIVAQSSSQINLEALENQVSSAAWSSNITTVTFDLHRTSVEGVFTKLCSLHTDAKSNQFFSALKSLEKLKPTEETIVILREADTLKSRQRSLFSYALSSLSRVQVVRILVTTSNASAGLDDRQLVIQIPLLTKRTLAKISHAIVPTKTEREKIKKIRQCFIPEQLLAQLAKELPNGAYTDSTKSIKAFRPMLPPQKLAQHEIQFLVALSLMGGTCEKETLIKALQLTEKQSKTVIKSLTIAGYIEPQQNRLFLNFPTNKEFKRLTGKLRKDTASALLHHFPIDGKMVNRYRLARFAGRERLAGYLAIKKARSISHRGKSNQVFRWFYRAFSCGVRLRQTILRDLVAYCLRQGSMRNARHLFIYMRQHFGLSYKLADLFLDFDDRLNNWRRAEKRAKQIAAIAKTKNHIKSYSYFSAKLAKFLIMQQHFAKAEKILRNLQENEVGSSQIRGITYHYLGLSFLFRGELENAVYEFNRATKERHQFLGNSYMNIGIAFAKMGKFLVAKRYVRKSIRIFSQCGDRNHLAYAYNNMGAILSHSAKREAAHHFLEKSVHLGQALKNNYIVTSALNNISQIYEMEARPDKAIEFYRKSTRIAGHEGSKINRVAALSNYGLQCAMQGDFNRAIQVLKNASVEIKTAGLKIELGFAYEYLGLTHMFSERPKIAVLYLHKAKRTFTVTGCDVDKLRINLYLALAYCHLKQLDTAANILASSTDFADDSFELGLRNYVSAYFRLIRGGASRATWTGEVRTAESIFRKVHNIFWLAKLHSLKGDFHLQNGEPEKADMSFERAADIFSRIGARKQPSNLKRKLNLIKERADMNAAIVKSLSYRMLGLIETLLAEETIDAMVAKILAASLELSQMVRGVLIIYGSPPRIYQTNPLEEGKVEEISELSGWALQSCLEFSTTYITSQDPHMSSRAIGNKKNLPLSLYFPLKTSESLLGMLYLEGSSDSRVTSKQLDVFANIASMNLERALKSEAYENQKLRYRKLLETRSIDV